MHLLGKIGKNLEINARYICVKGIEFNFVELTENGQTRYV